MPGSPDWNKLLDTYGLLEILERCSIEDETVLIQLFRLGYTFEGIEEPVDATRD